MPKSKVVRGGRTATKKTVKRATRSAVPTKKSAKQSAKVLPTKKKVVKTAAKKSTAASTKGKKITRKPAPVKRTQKIVKRESKKIVKKVSKVATKVGKKKGKQLGKEIGGAIGRRIKAYKNRPFTIKNAPIRKRKTLAGALEELDKSADALDSKLKQGELFAFSFFGNKSYQVFQSVSNLTSKLRQYKTVQQNLGNRGKGHDELINGIKIIKFKGTSKQWGKQKIKEVKAANAARLAEAKERAGLKRQVKKLKRENKKLKAEKRKTRKR